MTVFDGHAMRDDIVSSMLGGETDLETSKYLDRLVAVSYTHLTQPTKRIV